MNWFKSRRVKEDVQKANKQVAIWEKDFNMATMPDLGLFDEYLEMGQLSVFMSVAQTALLCVPFCTAQSF